MSQSIGIIGGADGPTAIFVSSSPSWINLFGLIFVVLLLIPNIIYAIRHKGQTNQCKNRLMNVLEQISRYGCMLLMVCNFGLMEFSFAFPSSFVLYFVGNGLLLLLYWGFWIAYAKQPSLFLAGTLAVLPTLIFLISAVSLRHWLLLAFALLFGVSHLYVTVVNAKAGQQPGDDTP